MPYKRRSRFWWTFSIPPPGPFFQKRGFFNSHKRLHLLTSVDERCGDFVHARRHLALTIPTLKPQNARFLGWAACGFATIIGRNMPISRKPSASRSIDAMFGERAAYLPGVCSWEPFKVASILA